MPEENLQIKNESGHVKVFSAPTVKTFANKLTFIIVLGILTLFAIGGLIFFFTYFDNDEKQHQLTAAEIELKRSKLLNYLKEISGSKTISGIFIDDLDTASYKGVQLIRKLTEVSPGVISRKMPVSKTKWTSSIAEVISNWKNHHLVRIVMWHHPMENLHGATDNDTLLERFWEDLIIDGGQVNKAWKNYLDQVAPYLRKLQNAGILLIFDILPFMNSEYKFLRGRPGVNGSTKLHQITHDYLTKKHNLTSLIWNWSLYSANMTEFEQFWPGHDYVDVASVNMLSLNELSMSEYERLINFVGDKPLSMEWMNTVPSVELLTAQPRWTWFTASDKYVEDIIFNSDWLTKETFNSVSVINKGSIAFFNDSDLTV